VAKRGLGLRLLPCQDSSHRSRGTQKGVLFSFAIRTDRENQREDQHWRFICISRGNPEAIEIVYSRLKE